MSFPNPKTRFFGRASDLVQLEALCMGRARLVTLWGPPGMGKTRLAVELCRAGHFPGAWFCDLSTAQDVEDICACVMRAVVDADPAERTSGAVGVALGALGPGVVVLDNFEHLAPYAALTVGNWIDAAPQITFVATSRAKLHVDGETAFEVLPLREGLALFMDRAPAPSVSEADVVATLVERLEGVPLAIELAAARVDVLGVEGLLARMDRPLEVLGRGSLQRTIESSFRLLAPCEARVLAQCAVFRGTFTVEEAEAIVAPEPDLVVLDVLEALHDHSLLRCVARGSLVRFAFFESIRSHAADLLRAHHGEPAARRRHARHYLASKTCDASNLADAIGWALDDEEMRRAATPDILESLARTEPSMLSNALAMSLERVLVLAETDCSAPSRARGHRTRGRALLLRGHVRQALEELERARTLAADDTDDTAAVDLAREIWADIGVVHHQLRDTTRARECYEAALQLNERASDAVARARCLGNLGALDHDLGHLDAALLRYQEAVAVFRAKGERRLEGTFLTNMAVVLQEVGAAPRARAMYTLAVECLEQAQDRRLEAIARTNYGLFRHELGELDEARACHEQALALLRHVTDGRSEGLCLGRLAMVLAALGHEREARLRCDRAEKILRGMDDRMSLELLQLFRAYVDVACGGDAVLARERLMHARQGAADQTPLVDRSDDARTTVRLIEREVARAGGAASVLVVGPDARWFIPPGSVLLDLGSRRVLRRLLWRLVEHHRASPGEGLTLDELRDAGWPGEHATPEAALNRVHVALTELRRRGLRSCLQRAESRYLIDPALRVELRES